MRAQRVTHGKGNAMGDVRLSFVNKPIFNSRVKSDEVRPAEKILGYLVGPVGPPW
jgi:hypothetical protein